MPFTPLYPNYAGIEPVLTAARAIVERDMTEALAWRFGTEPPGEDFKRIQYTQRHSKLYPLLIIQPARSNPTLLGAGGVNQDHVFDVEIFITADAGSDPNAAIDRLSVHLVRYLDALTMTWLTASTDDWIADFPEDNNASKVQASFDNVIFGQLEVATENASLYMRSVAFELIVRFVEAEG